MQLSQFDFDLPEELIAQYPADQRDHSRLLIVDRQSQEISEITFKDLTFFLKKEDRLIFNKTKVFPARLYGQKNSGARIEILLAKERAPQEWEVLAKPGKKLKKGMSLTFSQTLKAEVLEDFEHTKVLKFYSQKSFMQEIEAVGQIPLPPYIRRDKPEFQDKERYQTIYASDTGSIAAPTAGLHFTEKMLKELEEMGVEKHYLTLHVGLGTFYPILHENLDDHQMHSETYFLSASLIEKLNQKGQGRSICVGTTTLRALESAANELGQLTQTKAETRLFIQPGYTFKYVDHLLTNFHLPKSSLFILVSAFMGREFAQEVYKEAIRRKFRFFSYGDAMLIL